MCRETNINFDCYIINEDGNIFSRYWNKQLTGCYEKDGYTFVKLKLKNGQYGQFRLHRVVWVFFNGEIPDGLQIDHIIPIRNGGTNALSNLRLVTPKENTNNPISLSNMSKSQKGHKPTCQKNGKLSKPVIRIKSNSEVIEYPSAAEAGRNGLNNSEVIKCCNGGFYLHGKWVNRSHLYNGDTYYWKTDYSSYIK